MSWRNLKPTLNQLELLKKWGIQPGDLTRGEVSDIITEELDKSRDFIDYERGYDDEPTMREDWHYKDPFDDWN